MATRRRRKEAVQAETRLTVRVTSVGNEEEESTETLAVQQFETEPAYVRVNAGVTKNVGEYESLRVDVSISAPCYKEEVDDIIPIVGDVVADHLDKQVNLFMGIEDGD
jgi:hypothetical protein